jgi:hypothetical protein
MVVYGYGFGNGSFSMGRGGGFGKFENWANQRWDFRAVILLLLSAIAIFQCGGYVILIFALAWIIKSIHTWIQLGRGLCRPPRPVQAHFSAQGFGQRNGFGPIAIQPWSPDIRFEFDRQRRGRCRIKGFFDPVAALTENAVMGFEFDGSPEKIDEIVSRIRVWMEARGAKFRRVL